MKPGIYDISNEEYHNGPGVSRSGIMEFLKTPYHYWYKYLKPNREIKKATKSMEFGAAFHPYILEPELFAQDFAYEDINIDGRTAEGKQYRKEFKEKNIGKKILTHNDYLQLLGMIESIKNHPTAPSLIDGAQYEKSIYWIDPDTGILCKTRPDILHPNMACDLKSTSNASEREFQWAIKKFGYHIQAGMMHEGFKHALGIEILDFIFIAVEKDKPHAVAIYPLDEASLAKGIVDFKNTLVQFKNCLDTNCWPGYETKIVSLPQSAFYE